MLLTLQEFRSTRCSFETLADEVKNHFTFCSDGGRRAQARPPKKSHSARCFAVVRCHVGASSSVDLASDD